MAGEAMTTAERDQERAFAADMGLSFCESCGVTYHYEQYRPHTCAK